LMSGRVYFESLETHVFDAQGRWVRSWFFCEGCGRAYESKREAVECCRWGPSTTSKKVEAYTCLGCGRGFVDYQTLRAHIEEHERRALEADKLSSNPRANEALIGYEPGEGHLVSCDRCGAIIRRERAFTIFHGPHGEKTDYCSRCFEGEGVKWGRR
jgi:hypothetical protein